MLQPSDSDPLPSFAADVPITEPTTEPIHVAWKIHGKKQSNVYLDDHGYTNQSNEFVILLHNIKGGPILHKRKHPAPPFDDIDPRFEAHYDKATHKTWLQQELNLTHLDPLMREGIYKL